MPLLQLHSKIRIDAVQTFTAAEAFKSGGSIGGRVLSSVGWNFAEHFLASVEMNIPDMQVNAWTLLYTAGDTWLLSSLENGGLHRLQFLACIHRLMGLGDGGPCHLDGQSNFAYLRSPVDGRLWAAHWMINASSEWIIGAAAVPHPALDWRSGSRVFENRPTPL